MLMISKDVEPGEPIACFQNLEASAFQYKTGKRTDIVLVLDDQYDPAPFWLRFGCTGGNVRWNGRQSREQHLKSRALARCGGNLESAVVSANDSQHRGEAQTPPREFGGEKRVENLG